MNLSQEQKEVAFTDSNSVLCLAGAGSGKTRVLISRVQHLIEERHVSPYECFLCTFTRKAATEMRERLEKAIGSQANRVTIGTLHSVALNLIQRFGEFIGLNPGRITVYSAWEESVLLKDVCTELGYYDGKKFKGVKAKEINQAFNLFYTRKDRNERDDIPNEIMDAFFQRCRENNALTYGMIMTSFHDLIPKISKMINLKHVLVDEVQDLDNLQWRIIRLICSACNASLFVVGDDSQSIYGFRGADSKYLIRNQENFDIYKLADNYRSDKYIVKAANMLIVHNQDRLDLTMNSIRPAEKEIQYFSGQNSTKLAENIRLIPEIKESENVCVLARNHFLLEKLSQRLTNAGIDHKYVGKTTAFTRSEEFRRVHALLHVAANPFDNFSFMLCLDYFEIKRDQYKAIRMQAVKENKSHYQVFSGGNRNLWHIGFIDAVKAQKFKDVLDWMLGCDFNFDSIPVFEFIEQYVLENPNSSIQEYLDWLALYDVQDELTEETERLQLMTIHASKGLEFDVVIIAGMNEGILPSFRANELESERRLAYVAYTRARDQLILTSRPIDPEAKIKQPVSRFIKESI